MVVLQLQGRDGSTLEEFSLREPKFVSPTLGLLDMLSLFQESSCHLALISEDPFQAAQCLRTGQRPIGKAVTLGLITLEDVLETLIQEQIQDETDDDHRPSIYPFGFNSTSLVSRIISEKRNKAADISSEYINHHSSIGYSCSNSNSWSNASISKNKYGNSGSSSSSRRGVTGAGVSKQNMPRPTVRKEAAGSPPQKKREGDMVHVHIQLPPAALTQARFSPQHSRSKQELKQKPAAHSSLRSSSADVPIITMKESSGVLPFIQQMQSYSSMEEITKCASLVRERKQTSNQTPPDSRPSDYYTPADLDSFEWM